MAAIGGVLEIALLIGVAFLLGLALRKRRAKEQGNYAEIAKGEAEIGPIGFGKLHLIVPVTIAAIMPALAVNSFISAKDLSFRLGAGVWLDFSASVAVGVMFTYFAKRREGSQLPNLLIYALYASPLLYIVTPIVINLWLTLPIADHSAIAYNRVYDAMMSVMLGGVTLVIAYATQKRYRRVTSALEAASRGEIPPVYSAKQGTSTSWRNSPNSPWYAQWGFGRNLSTRLITGGAMLGFWGLSSLASFIYRVEDGTNTNGLAQQAVVPIVELAVAVVLVWLGIKLRSRERGQDD